MDQYEAIVIVPNKDGRVNFPSHESLGRFADRAEAVKALHSRLNVMYGAGELEILNPHQVQHANAPSPQRWHHVDGLIRDHLDINRVYEEPLLDFGAVVDCPYCIDSSGNICVGHDPPMRDPSTGESVSWEQWYFDMCPDCGGTGQFIVIKEF